MADASNYKKHMGDTNERGKTYKTNYLDETKPPEINSPIRESLKD